MAKITINEEGLSRNAKVIAKKIDELNQLNSQLESLINQISLKWEGGACDAYVRMMKNYLAQAKSMVKILQEYKKYAESVSMKFSVLDKNAANRINGSW